MSLYETRLITSTINVSHDSPILPILSVIPTNETFDSSPESDPKSVGLVVVATVCLHFFLEPLWPLLRMQLPTTVLIMPFFLEMLARGLLILSCHCI
jgi:hypothetical protein